MASFYTPPTLSEMEEEGLLLLGSQGRRKFQKSGWATTKIQTKSPFERYKVLLLILLSKYEGELAPPAPSGSATPGSAVWMFWHFAAAIRPTGLLAE